MEGRSFRPPFPRSRRLDDLGPARYHLANCAGAVGRLNATGGTGFGYCADCSCIHSPAHKRWETRNSLADAAHLSQHNRRKGGQLSNGQGRDQHRSTRRHELQPRCACYMRGPGPKWREKHARNREAAGFVQRPVILSDKWDR